MAFAVASTVLHDLLRSPSRPARVIAALPAAVYLEVLGARTGPRMVALLARDAVRVPIGMVVALPLQAAPFGAVIPGTTARIGDGVLSLDGAGPAKGRSSGLGSAGLGSAGAGEYRPLRYWDPRVPRLRAGLSGPAALRRAEALTGLVGDPGGQTAVMICAPVAERVPNLADAVRALELALAEPAPRPAALARAVRGLTGLGPGLTPAGDDVLAGALVALAAAGDDRRRAALATEVRRRLSATTCVSAALLEQACHGRAVPELSALLRALAGVADLDAALLGLSLVGHTSGPALGVGVRAVLRARSGAVLGRVA